MPLLDQMTGRQPGAVAVVQGDTTLFKTRQNTVDQHHAGDLFHQPGELVVRDHFRVHHQRSAAMADKLLNCLALFFNAVIPVADQQKVTGVVGHLLDGFDHSAEERIGHVAHHQTDGFRRLLRQRARICIGMIIERFHRRSHRLARGFTGFGGVVDHAGYGSDGHSSESGYILNCRHTRPFIG